MKVVKLVVDVLVGDRHLHVEVGESELDKLIVVADERV